MRLGRVSAGLSRIRLQWQKWVGADRHSGAWALVLVVLLIGAVTNGCSGETPPRDTQRETQLADRIQAAGGRASWYTSLELANGRPVINILRSSSLAALELIPGIAGGS